MVPPRLALDGGLTRPQGTRGGGGLPVEGTDTELRSSRSVTNTESSAGLKNQEVKTTREITFPVKTVGILQAENTQYSKCSCEFNLRRKKQPDVAGKL